MSGPMFCNNDDTIYLGEDGMWDFYNANDRGDAINVVVMAHEWGHHVQMHMGALSSHPTLAEMQKQELQADCISGAAAQFMHQKGYFSDDDLNGVLSFMPNIPTDKYGTHGTNEQRMRAFETGYSSGMAACNPIGISSVTPQ
jgi:predicted metalloprotease